MWAKLDKEGVKPALLQVNTKEIFEKGFQFPDVAKNDEAVNILEPIDIAQKNLNSNPDNKMLMDKFISTAQSTIKNLSSEFKDFWTDPTI